MLLTKSHDIAYDFFFGCLQAIASGKVLPEKHPGLTLAALNKLIRRHHLQTIFIHHDKQQNLRNPHTNKAKQQLIYRTKRRLLLAAEMLKLVRAFNSLHMHFIILKGIPLSQQLYDNPYLRDPCDLDFLVKPAALLQAHHCLLQQGYKLESSLTPQDLLHDYEFFLPYIEELHYFHPTARIHIDLKCHASAFHCHAMQWCDHSKTSLIQVHSETVTTLNPEQNFFYLSVHAAKHGWEHLKWLLDLAIFYKKIPFCWATVITMARDTQAIRPLLETSMLLQKFFQINLGAIPHSYMDKAIVTIRLYFIQRQWTKKRWHETLGGKYIFLLINFLLYPGITQKCHYLTLIFLLRKKSLRLIGKIKKPSSYKLILRSFFG